MDDGAQRRQHVGTRRGRRPCLRATARHHVSGAQKHSPGDFFGVNRRRHQAPACPSSAGYKSSSPGVRSVAPISAQVPREPQQGQARLDAGESPVSRVRATRWSCALLDSTTRYFVTDGSCRTGRGSPKTRCHKDPSHLQSLALPLHVQTSLVLHL